MMTEKEKENRPRSTAGLLVILLDRYSPESCLKKALYLDQYSFRRPPWNMARRKNQSSFFPMERAQKAGMCNQQCRLCCTELSSSAGNHQMSSKIREMEIKSKIALILQKYQVGQVLTLCLSTTGLVFIIILLCWNPLSSNIECALMLLTL